MKNGKKFVLIALILVLVATTILAFTGPGKWAPIKKGQDLSVSIGRAGASFTDSFYAGTVNVYRQNDAGFKPLTNFQFTQDFVGVKFFDKSWNPIKIVTGSVYVFFNLRPQEQKALAQNRLSIYYWDTWKGFWKVCPTVAINGGTTASCRIRNFGLYSLMYRDP